MAVKKDGRFKARIYRTDKQAAAMAAEHINFARQIVLKHYMGLCSDYKDLVQVGYLGLFEAAKRFDDSKGVRFISFAVHWVHERIRAYLNEREVHLPDKKIVALCKVHKAIERLQQQLKREPEIKEIANYSSLTVEQVQESLMALDPRNTISLFSHGKNNDDEPQELINTLPAPMRDIDMSDCYRAILKLPKREKHVIMHLILRDTTKTELLEEMGISRKWLHQIKNKAINRMRQFIGEERPF